MFSHDSNNLVRYSPEFFAACRALKHQIVSEHAIGTAMPGAIPTFTAPSNEPIQLGTAGYSDCQSVESLSLIRLIVSHVHVASNDIAL
jgi:hypothetical protein